MIKIFSNKTVSPKIRVESKFVRDKVEIVKPINGYVNTTNNDLLFVKLTFDGVTDEQQIGKIQMLLLCENSHGSRIVKVYKARNTSISDANVKALASLFVEDEETIETTAISSSGLNQIPLDITGAIGASTIQNKSIMIIIKRSNLYEQQFRIYDPAMLASEAEICSGTLTEVSGLDPIYKYDEHSIASCGVGYINLFNGKLIHKLDGFSSLSNKVPISFSIVANKNKTNKIDYMQNNLTPNFQNRIYMLDDYYVIEDASGKKSYYRPISRENIEETNGLGIKHLSTSGDIYFCDMDYSYFYLISSSTGKTIQMYDKYDNCIHFEISIDGITKIILQENSLGDNISYTWSGNYLEKIKNSIGEKVLFTYTANKLTKVYFVDLKRFIEFTYGTNKVTVCTYYTTTRVTGSITKEENEKLSEVELHFNSNGLTKAVDIMTGYILQYTYNSSKQITNVKTLSVTAKTQYSTDYSYTSNYTVATDFEGNKMFYYFDNYGRIKTEMDDKARTISYNYDELENGESKHLVGLSNVQNNSRNLLENHGFEDSENLFNTSLGWQLSGCTNSKVEAIQGGIYGEKCLFIEKSAGEIVTISQKVSSSEAGTYRLKGYIKYAPKNSSEVIGHGDICIRIRSTYVVDEEVLIRVGSTNNYKTEIRPVGHFAEGITNLGGSSDWCSFLTSSCVIPSNAYNISIYVDMIVKGVEADIYVDHFQLSDGYQITRYNLIENGYMEFVTSNRPTGWQFEGLWWDDYVEALPYTDDHPSLLGKNAMKFSSGDIDTASGNEAVIRKMYKNISVKGIAGEQLVFTVFAKANATSKTIFRAYMKLNYRNGTSKLHNFDFDKNFNNWQVLTRAVTTEFSYDSVEIGIEYNGGSTAYFDCFQLYKDAYGKYYNYDKIGNIIEAIDASGTYMSIKYNDENKIQEIFAQDGSHFKYKYDYKGRLSSITDISLNSIMFTYDTSNNIIKTQIYNKLENITYSMSQTYNTYGSVVSSTDEFGETTIKTFDYLNRVTNELFPNGLSMNYKFNNYSELTKMNASVERVEETITNILHSNEYSYDEAGQVKEVVSANGTKYLLSYDEFGRITSIKRGNEVINTLTYSEYTNGINRGLLSRKQYGASGDYYDFKYNQLGQVEEVQFNGTIIATYQYDENGNISEVFDVLNERNTYKTYDLKGKLVKLTSKNKTISYTYDNLNNIQKTTYELNGKSRSIDYEYEHEFNEYTKEGYFSRLEKIFTDEVIKGENNAKGTYGATPRLKIFQNPFEEDINMLVYSFEDKYDFIWYDMDEFNSNRTSGYSNGQAFSLSKWKKDLINNKTFYAWIKPRGSFGEEENIFLFQKVVKSSSNNGADNITMLSGLYITTDGKIAYRTYDSSYYKCKTSTALKLNQWNLVGVKLFKSEGSTSSKCKITLNGTTTFEYNISENISTINHLVVSNQDTSAIVPTGSSGGAVSSSLRDLKLPFKICYMSFGAYDYSNDEFKAIYDEGLNYLTKDAPKKSNGIIYYNNEVYKDFDVITLNGSLESAQGLKPVELVETDKSFKTDKAKIFKYDSDLEKHVYGSYDSISNLTPGNKSLLAYKLGLENRGTISLSFKVDDIVGNKCIFSNMLNSIEKLGIYCVNGIIKMVINDAWISTEKNISSNTWYNLTFTFDSDGYKLYVNGGDWYSGSNLIDLTDTICYIGTTTSDKGQILNGLIEMLAFSKVKVASTAVTDIYNKGKSIIIREKLDNLGRISQKQILVNDNEIVTNYTYDKFRINKETNNDLSTIEYTYDSVGNITKKEASGSLEDIINNQYTYDKLGRLIKEVKQNGDIETFTYDENGNILTRKYVLHSSGIILAHEQYEYDSVVKDRLLRIRNLITNTVIKEFKYNGSYKGNPTTISFNGVNKDLIWKGRRLTRIGNDITYTYNEEGIRIKKQTPNETTTFELEGSNIIHMDMKISSTNYSFDFTYDVRGNVTSFTYDGKEYFYERDITGNINKLLDETGSCVVKYRYLDAWGNHEVLNPDNTVNTTSTFIGNLNPFRYKGYYFDEETQLFYCNSRYYSPELCRWISPDSIEYLDPESINGLNLYCYCMNNPIMYVDPSGHSALLALCLFAVSSLAMWGVSELFGAQIAGGIGSVTGGATAISTGISLCAFGPWGIFAGIALMAVGGLTIAFGANEIVDGVTGTNYIQNWTGWSDEVYNGVYICLNVASAVGSIAGNIGMRIASNHILKGIVNNPESVQQYRLWQLKTYGKYTTQYVPGTLRKGEHIGQGYTLTHVKGGPNGYIQWHPGSRHHYNGLPYWKVTSALGGTWRGLYLF